MKNPDPKQDDVFQRHMQQILKGIPSAISLKLTLAEPPSGEVTHPVEEVNEGVSPQVRDVIQRQPSENIPAVVPAEQRVGFRVGFIDQLVHKIFNFLKWLFGLFSRRPAQSDTKEVPVPSVVMSTTNVGDKREQFEKQVQAVTEELAKRPPKTPDGIPEAPPGLSGATDEEQMIALMHMLTPLRTEFVCTCLFSDGDSRAQQAAAVRYTLDNLNGVRNTWAAQSSSSGIPTSSP